MALPRAGAEQNTNLQSARRGVRASFYRPSTRKPATPDATTSSPCSSARHNPLPIVRSPHEMLLDACEEGDYVAVMACLQQPDAHLHLNLHGYARNVVAARCPDTGAIEQWGHPEALTTTVATRHRRYAAFHGFARIVEALLAAGALPVLRNDDAKGAIDLVEYGRITQEEGQGGAPLPADLPRGDPEERTEVIQMLQEALEHQVVINCTERPDFNGRIAQFVAATNDGRRLGIINDAATASRPYYEKSESRRPTSGQSS